MRGCRGPRATPTAVARRHRRRGALRHHRHRPILGPDGVDAWAVGTWRILVGALALWVVAGTFPKPGRVNPASRRVLLLGSIGVAAYQPGFFIATDRCGSPSER